MVAHFTSNNYWRLQGDTDEGESGIDIELREQSGQNGYNRLHTANIDRNEYDVTKRVSSGTSITHMPDDDYFLLATRPMNDLPERTDRQRFLSGWRIGTLASLIGAVSVLSFNYFVTIWVWKGPGHEIKNGNGALLRGKCNDVRRMNVWAHVLVNAISTLLLCASNYCMQVLSAPNRAELDRAHAQQHWLHIGVPNLRNLKHIGRKRRILWYLLGLSSMPLHLLFNSVVFTNLQANKYTVIPTTEDWLSGGAYDNSSFVGIPPSNNNMIRSIIDGYRVNLTERLSPPNDNTPRYTNVSTADCFDIYNKQYLAEFGNVYLIQDLPTVWRDLRNWTVLRNNSNGNFIWTTTSDSKNIFPKYPTYSRQEIATEFPFRSSPDRKQSVSNAWMCPSHSSNCDVNNRYEVPQNRSDWSPYDRRIRYCIVEQVQGIYCKLEFSLPIAGTVMVANLIKVVCMAVMLFTLQDHSALVTVGDVVACYLERSDQETYGRCLYSRQDFEAEWDTKHSNRVRKWHDHIKPARYKPKARRWAMAASQDRWIWTYITYFAIATLAIPSIFYSLKGMPKDVAGLWKVGFGTVSNNNLLNITLPLLGGILVANIPQALLSYFYLAFNALYTNMFVAYEWSTYLDERKPLRVTSPRGRQRTTYWLNVPFRYAIPMTIISSTFHWLASQSIFMVQMTVTDEHRQPAYQISTCGYSPMAIILTFSVGTVIAGSGIIVSFFRYTSGIPLASSCSAAISAACHALPEDVNASSSSLQWGAVTHGVVEDGKEPVGHCTFSSFSVEPPIPGRLYA